MKDIFWRLLYEIAGMHFDFKEVGMIGYYGKDRADRCALNDYFRNIQTVRKLYEIGKYDWFLETYTHFLCRLGVGPRDENDSIGDVKISLNIFDYPVIFNRSDYEKISLLINTGNREIFNIFTTYKILVMGNVFLSDILSVIGRLMLDIF